MVRVIKKDNTKEAFNIQKVVIAVNKSANRVLYTFTEDELKAICDHVESYIREHGLTEVQIWQTYRAQYCRSCAGSGPPGSCQELP